MWMEIISDPSKYDSGSSKTMVSVRQTEKIFSLKQMAKMAFVWILVFSFIECTTSGSALKFSDSSKNEQSGSGAQKGSFKRTYWDRNRDPFEVALNGKPFVPDSTLIYENARTLYYRVSDQLEANDSLILAIALKLERAWALAPNYYSAAGWNPENKIYVRLKVASPEHAKIPPEKVILDSVDVLFRQYNYVREMDRTLTSFLEYSSEQSQNHKVAIGQLTGHEYFLYLTQQPGMRCGNVYRRDIQMENRGDQTLFTFTRGYGGPSETIVVGVEGAKVWLEQKG